MDAGCWMMDVCVLAGELRLDSNFDGFDIPNIIAG